MTRPPRGGDPTPGRPLFLATVDSLVSISDAENDALKREKEHADAKRKRFEWETRFRAAVPTLVATRVLNGTLEHWPGTKAVRDWLAEGTPRHLMLRGPTRCGKSVAAALAVWLWIEPQDNPAKNRRALYLTTDQLVSAILHEYDEASPKLEGVSLLVVDDIGTENRPSFVDAWRQLLDRGKCAVLMTSHLDKLAMRERYRNPALIWRLLETTNATELPQQGPTDLPEHGDF